MATLRVLASPARPSALSARLQMRINKFPNYDDRLIKVCVAAMTCRRHLKQ